jgi:hypothetical protein
MNKEAKIGLAVILGLLIIFIGVVAKRVYSSHAAEQAVAATDKDAGSSEVSAGLGNATSDKTGKAKKTNATAGQPTVLAATPDYGKPPKGSTNGDDLWNVTIDSGRSKNSAGSTSGSKSLPSYMPEPPKPGAENRYDRYGNSDRPATSYRHQQNVEGAPSDTADTDRRYNSLREGPDRNATADSSLALRSKDNMQTAVSDDPVAGSDSDNRHLNSTSDRYTSIASTAGDYRNSADSARTSTSAAAGRTYTVADGDSLFDIARRELGKASRWVEIYDLNIDVLGKDIDSIAPGTQIVLPNENSQQAEPFTRRPRAEYRR